MDEESRTRLEQLQPLVGQWTIEPVFPGAEPPTPGDRGHTVFEWGPERAFLIQRWEVPIEGPPDGVAIFAFAEQGGALVQHYFDSRGVVRRYETGIDAGIWSLRKLSAGFAQRFRGEFSTDGKTIEGVWEKADDGSTWEHDFELVYRRVD
jgi:hypothetical protein